MVFKAMVKMRFQGVKERGRRRRKKTGREYRSRVENRGVPGLSLGSTTLQVQLEEKPK